MPNNPVNEKILKSFKKTAEPASMANLKASVVIPETYKPNPKIYTTFTDAFDWMFRLSELGWSAEFTDFSDFKTGQATFYSYVLENNIASPRVRTIYHGTSAGFHDQILKKGLGNTEQHVNAGMRDGKLHRGKVNYTVDYKVANNFAKTTCKKLDQKSVPLAKSECRTPILYKWESAIDLNYDANFSGLTDVVDAAALQFSLDEGITWYPAAMFNIESKNRQALVVPDYGNPTIKAFLVKNKNIANQGFFSQNKSDLTTLAFKRTMKNLLQVSQPTNSKPTSPPKMN